MHTKIKKIELHVFIMMHQDGVKQLYNNQLVTYKN